MREAVRAVIDLGFEHYRLHRVVAEMDARNDTSARLASSVGMRCEAHHLQNYWSRGEWTDSLTIEAAAGKAFRSFGMPEVADDPLPDMQQLKRHASDGRVWVAWARDRGDERLTLTTFADVPWNAPYYRWLGFRALPDDALGPQLAAELSEERKRFTAPRIAMVRDV